MKIRSFVQRAASAFGLIGALALTASCLDSDPLDYHPNTDAGEHDAATDAARGAACRGCLFAPEDPGPGCATSLADCSADELCLKLLDCTLSLGCLENASLNSRLECSTPCLDQLGLTSFTDPVIIHSFPAQACSLKECRSVCVIE